MRIVYDGRWVGRTGIGRYTTELLEQLQRLDQNNEYYVLLRPEAFAQWRATSPRFHAVRTTYDVYTWQEQLLLPWQIWRLRPDLVHFTNFNLPILYPGRFIATIHDLTLVHFKNNRGEGLKKFLYEVKYWTMRGILRVVTRRAQRLLVPCQFVKDDVVSRYRAAAHKTTITPEAVDAKNYAEPADISRFKLPKTFLFYIGNSYPYKNLERLILAFMKTKAQVAGAKLVLAGNTAYFSDQLKKTAIKLGAQEAVIFPGRISDGEAATLYQKAALYAFPSLYEGFGLPGLEAMVQGTPVLAARASCLPEIYGDAAAYFDPLDPNDMAHHIDELLNDPAHLKQLRAAGYERVKRYSWRTMAELTLAAYRAQ